MSIDDMIAVLQAAKEGKDVEVKRHGDGQWTVRSGNPADMDTYCYDYRVKPESREWNVSVGEYALYFNTNLGHPVIKVREVLQ